MRRRRALLPILGTLALLAPLVYLWQASLVPRQFTVHEMGYVDHGVGPGVHAPGTGHGPGHGTGASVSVDTLIADPDRRADVRVKLVAAEATLDIGAAGCLVSR